jgi:hypothetical protein
MQIYLHQNEANKAVFLTIQIFFIFFLRRNKTKTKTKMTPNDFYQLHLIGEVHLQNLKLDTKIKALLADSIVRNSMTKFYCSIWIEHAWNDYMFCKPE